MDLAARDFSAAGRRSLQRISCPVSQLDVGTNVVGKSNPYRALELLQAPAPFAPL